MSYFKISPEWYPMIGAALFAIFVVSATFIVKVDHGDEICLYDITGKTCYDKIITMEFKD